MSRLERVQILIVCSLAAILYAIAPPGSWAQIPGGSFPSATNQGPSTVHTPYVVPTAAGVRTVSIFTVGTRDTSGTTTVDSTAKVGGGSYIMVGKPDGLGAYNNGNGTFTLVMNQEIGSSGGATRAHGATGSFVSKYTINSSSLAVINGEDLIKQIATWNTSTNAYNAPASGSALTLTNFCSATLAPVSAFYNASTGKGYNGQIFMGGEETGEGRAFAHVVLDDPGIAGNDAGVSYQLPHLGRAAWENSVANPNTGDKTVVIGMDDTSPNGQVYLYVGTKQNTGNAAERAGLTSGSLYGISVSGFTGTGASNNESAGFVASSTAFSLVDMNARGIGPNSSGSSLQTASDGTSPAAMEFLRPEDGAWDPRPGYSNVFYFNTTNAALPTGRSKLWRLTFTDINNPQLGGLIDTLLDGTEGQEMLDNLTPDRYGNILLEEDPSSSRLARLWNYNIATDTLTELARSDSARFGGSGVAPYSNSEELSGIIDASSILGPGWFLLDVQAHYSGTTNGITTEMVEGGQLLALYSPLSVPEPSSIALAIPGGFGLLWLARRARLSGRRQA